MKITLFRALQLVLSTEQYYDDLIGNNEINSVNRPNEADEKFV